MVACNKMNLEGIWLLCMEAIIFWKQSAFQAIDMGELGFQQTLGKVYVFKRQ